VVLLRRKDRIVVIQYRENIEKVKSKYMAEIDKLDKLLEGIDK
jgi:hypothetical protein